MPKMEWRTGSYAVLALIALALYGCPSEQQQTATPPPAPATPPPAPAPAPVALPPGVTQDMVTRGQQLFTGSGNCLACHGPDGGGTALAPNLRDQNWLNIQRGDISEIETVIRTGVPQPKEAPAPMPPMGGAQLTDDQIRDLAAYVYSISHGG